MKSVFRRLAIAGTLGLSAIIPASAGPEHPVKPLLWKVEGPGLAEPSYLFGTMHLGDKAVVTLHPAAEEAFKKSAVLHAEVPLDMASQLASLDVMMRGDGKTLDEVIGEKLAKRLDLELKKINPELDSKPFQPMKTWVMAYSLPYLPEQLAGIKPLDLVLWERAEMEGKKTAGMQEIKDQVVGFSELSEEEQTQFLGSSLDYMENERRDGRDRMKEAIEVYLSGDAVKIEALATEWMEELAGGKDGPIMKKLTQRILKDRDVIMADYIVATLKKDPESVHFFAAGAGHYVGGDSVPARLVKNGYTVTPVEE